MGVDLHRVEYPIGFGVNRLCHEVGVLDALSYTFCPSEGRALGNDSYSLVSDEQGESMGLAVFPYSSTYRAECGTIS